jgi:hypothetical protein
MPKQLHLLLDSNYLSNLTDFTSPQQGVVRNIYKAAQSSLFKVMVGFATLIFHVSLCAIRKLHMSLEATGVRGGERVEKGNHGEKF